MVFLQPVQTRTDQKVLLKFEQSCKNAFERGNMREEINRVLFVELLAFHFSIPFGTSLRSSGSSSMVPT